MLFHVQVTLPHGLLVVKYFFSQHGLLGQVFPCIVFAVQSVIVLWIKDSILQRITPFFVIESFCLSSHLSQILPSGKLT